jgi:DNA-binding LytR/AlgR family response regulator
MVRLGDHIHSVTTDAVALFYAVDRDVFLLTNQRRKYIIDYKLEELEELLDPARFFRVNRTFIVGHCRHCRRGGVFEQPPAHPPAPRL